MRWNAMRSAEEERNLTQLVGPTLLCEIGSPRSIDKFHSGRRNVSQDAYRIQPGISLLIVLMVFLMIYLDCCCLIRNRILIVFFGISS